ncbi:hypothetical protein MGN70_005077 [Eutypa lata]|nr:hypothetical protein MGN70_005077 [Eutypa lata]
MTTPSFHHSDDNEKGDVKFAENVADSTPSSWEIQQRFETLRELSEGQMTDLNIRARKIIDWRMMPCITVIYMDRINVSNARLAGMQKDCGMDDTTWSAGISTFYVGYMVGQLPGNAWSVYTIYTVAIHNGVDFCIIRFLTGLFEAPFFPAITLMTSSWYTKEENPIRMAVWHAGNTISDILSGFLAAGILTNMGGVAGMRSWQWFFLIEGAASITMALTAYFLLPDWPHNTRFLTQQQRDMAQYRILLSNGGKEERDGGLWEGVKEAVKDLFTWFFCLMNFSLTLGQSSKDFLPSIMETFNFDQLTTYLVQAPSYAIAYASACTMAWSSGRRQESFWHIVVPIALSAVGGSVLIATLNVGARYFGLILLICGTYSGLNLQLSGETTLVPAPRAKKAALIAIANSVSQSSHWFSP